MAAISWNRKNRLKKGTPADRVECLKRNWILRIGAADHFYQLHKALQMPAANLMMNIDGRLCQKLLYWRFQKIPRNWRRWANKLCHNLRKKSPFNERTVWVLYSRANRPSWLKHSGRPRWIPITVSLSAIKSSPQKQKLERRDHSCNWNRAQSPTAQLFIYFQPFSMSEISVSRG